MATGSVKAPKPDSRLAVGGCLLGVALGGFFDGIVLHQILQWHHLFSARAPAGTVPDLRFQLLADGLFHLLHYVIALTGLAFLWSSRRTLQTGGAGRRLLGWSMVGFGGWHVFDAVVSHWLLQIHRIRMDVDNPLLWDLAWLFPFGILALAFGVWLLRSRPGKGAGAPGGRITAASLALAALVAGPVAAIPPAGPPAGLLAGAPDSGMTLAVFRPGVSFGDIVAAADAVDGRLVWTDETHGVWLISLGPGAKASQLYRHGALMVSSGAIAVGCLSWIGVV